jgi:hypothetical protein
VKPPENAQEAMSRDYWGKIHKRLKDAEKGQPEKFDSLPGF